MAATNPIEIIKRLDIGEDYTFFRFKPENASLISLKSNTILTPYIQIANSALL